MVRPPDAPPVSSRPRAGVGLESPTPSERQPLRLVIAGLGAIGAEVARAVRAGAVPGVRLAAAVEPETVAARAELRAAGVPVLDDLAQLDWARVDAVLEAASQDALRAIAPQVLRRGADLVALSAGAVQDAAFLAELLAQASASGARIWLPSGALGALDVVRAASAGRLDAVTLTTTKPPRALADAPYVTARGIDVAGISERRQLFDGSPAEAVRGFPQNVNVAALLALAAGDAARLRVRVIADPAAPGNVHEVEARGSFGAMRLRLENRPSPANPKTSALAAHSIIALLRQLGSPLRFA